MITDKYMAEQAISYGFTYIARDKNQVLFFYENKPEKYDKREAWDDSEEGEAAMVTSFFSDEIGSTDDYKIFKMVKWEDEEPTKLVDIALEEPEEKKTSIRKERKEGSTKIRIQQNIFTDEKISVYTLLHIAYAKGYRQIVRNEDNTMRLYSDCTLEKMIDNVNLMVQRGHWKVINSENYDDIRTASMEDFVISSHYHIIEDGYDNDINSPDSLLAFIKWTDLEPTKISDLIF